MVIKEICSIVCRKQNLLLFIQPRWQPIEPVAPPEGGRGEASPLWVDVQKLCNMCVHCLRSSPGKGPLNGCVCVQCSKCVSFWGTSYYPL